MVPPLAVSMGDPAGIGPDVIAKAWALGGLPPFAMVGDAQAVAAVWDGPLETIATLADVGPVFGRALPVLDVGVHGAITPGVPDEAGARAALNALTAATALARAGEASGLVTGPVGKAELYRVGFDAPGQTEFVADACGVSRDAAVMMLAGPTLRVVPLTTHVALARVPVLLTTALIVVKARITAAALVRDFGVERPRLALAGLNPHAGEQGTMGTEERDVMAPALTILRDDGIDIAGPLPADTLFHARARARYDAVLCPYHDQALIPLKTLHFDEGVNVTLGLPIVRTSPDHGTAFDIAGQGLAHPGAIAAAIRLAGEMAARRAA